MTKIFNFISNSKTEMKLVDFYLPDRSDKNTLHSYLDLYQQVLEKKQDSAKRVLEIGVQRGGSIKMWHDFFQNAEVHGLDIMGHGEMWPDLFNHPRIHLRTSVDAYKEEFVNREFLDKNIRFDFILDDGPHTLISMMHFLRYYIRLLKDDGILIIEDIQDIDWIKQLVHEIPGNLLPCCKVYDLRGNKGRYDDIVLVIDKNV